MTLAVERDVKQQIKRQTAVMSVIMPPNSSVEAEEWREWCWKASEGTAKKS